MQSLAADSIALGALRVRFLVEPEQSSGSVSVFECTVPPGAKVPAPHSHDAFEETIYGLLHVDDRRRGGRDQTGSRCLHPARRGARVRQQGRGRGAFPGDRQSRRLRPVLVPRDGRRARRGCRRTSRSGGRR